MDLLSTLFGRMKKRKKRSSEGTLPREVKVLLDLECQFFTLLQEDRFVSRRDYRQVQEDFDGVRSHFDTIMSSGVFPEYCEKYGLDKSRISAAWMTFGQLEEMVDRHNQDFLNRAMVEEKLYLDQILKKVDPAILLDEDQRQVVLTEEDYSLVIAGAGAGKTTTVAAKVKYLVEKRGVDPKQLLIVSFTNKAVDELKEKINKDLGIDCPITTFHSAGNAILRKRTPERKKVVDSGYLYYVLMDYFKGNVLHNDRMVRKLILFFGSYFDAPYDEEELNAFFDAVSKGRYETLRSDMNEFIVEISDKRNKRQISITNEILRSRQEVEIANFLFLNGIDYQYEPVYPYNFPNARKPYMPDFILQQGERSAYLEHFGVSETGENNRFSPDQIESYKRSIKDKILLHRDHGTKLIYTFSAYKDGRPLVEHLKEQLEKHGFELKPRPPREVLEKLLDGEQSRYIRRMVQLVNRFISNFKTNGYDREEFQKMARKTRNVRTKLFLEICEECYLEYQRRLKEDDAVDFQDMINESAKVLREVKEMKQMLDFEHIIVDEYQDISRQRFDLTKELAEVTNAKIMAVGDDWQSIYAFSGSDITLFTVSDQ